MIADEPPSLPIRLGPAQLRIRRLRHQQLKRQARHALRRHYDERFAGGIFFDEAQKIAVKLMGNIEVERFFAIVLADHARRPNSPADAEELSQLTHFRGNVLGPNVKRGKTRIAWRYDPHESLSRRRR